ncbi:subtilisin-like protein [Lactarius psammicola]|nr:subtilisin-like protein [Lactarius psammicola]
MRYHHLSVLTVLAAVPLANSATSLVRPWDDIRVKHTWNAVPSDWITLGHPPAGTTIDLHVAVKAHNENALIDALYNVSDPESPGHVLSNTLPRTMYSHVPLPCRRYGAHLSKEQVAQLVAPHPDTLELINSWLEHHGVPSSSISTTHGGSWLTLTGVPVSQANALLGASYQLYRRTGTNDTTILRTIGYALPAVLHTHVQTVVPTTYFTSTRTLQQIPWRSTLRAPADMASSRNPEIKPPDLRWLYKTSAYVPVATDRNTLGIGGFMNEYPSPVDLKTFMTECREDAVGTTYRVALINGGLYDPSHPAVEANLNMQWTQAMAYPTPHIFYSTGGDVRIDDNKPVKGDVWLEWLSYVLKQKNIPQTITTPYSDFESNLPLEYTTALCKLFAQLGALGASIILTSGNNGVGNAGCMANDGSGRVQFIPEFPSTCPWVTSVGGTTGGTTFEDPEVAASLSGGGFSNHFSRPDYQDEVVPTFLRDLGSKYYGLYNPAGRGIPDISAQALQIFLISNNGRFLADGTSAAAPVGAHSASSIPGCTATVRGGLNDIISGNNPGCGTDGFSAITGWDPVTGLGTPDFVNLQHTLLGWF